jgi:spore maturation protein CgeB
MRFLILNTDYFEFLRWLYTQSPELDKQTYENQMEARNKSLFGVADFYSSNLRRLGHEARDVHANNLFMQRAWASEHGVHLRQGPRLGQQPRLALQRAVSIAGRTPLRHLRPLVRPVLGRLSVDDSQTWYYDILGAQIKHYKPDVLLNQAMDAVGSRFLKEMKPYTRLIAGQIASPVPNDDFGCYDLVISSLPNVVDHFRRMGLRAELQRLAFEPGILERFKGDSEGSVPVSFIGNLFQAHSSRIRWLEHICGQLDVSVWGIGVNNLSQDSPIRRCHKGTAWGIQMYEILHNSQITLNNHIDMAGPYANNCRLYEATGMGTLLITDWKENLHEMFEPGKEVVAYRTPEECFSLIQYYLGHNKERETIAHSGQERTLREHTYYNRMQELVKVVHKYL